MPAYKLTYFDAKARAEVPRLLFAKAGVQYEDVRVNEEQFKELKDSKYSIFSCMKISQFDEQLNGCEGIFQFIAQNTVIGIFLRF